MAARNATLPELIYRYGTAILDSSKRTIIRDMGEALRSSTAICMKEVGESSMALAKLDAPRTDEFSTEQTHNNDRRAIEAMFISMATGITQDRWQTRDAALTHLKRFIQDIPATQEHVNAFAKIANGDPDDFLRATARSALHAVAKGRFTPQEVRLAAVTELDAIDSRRSSKRPSVKPAAGETPPLSAPLL
ncbi:MAG: hypothetical protein WDO70_10145 [Alphaproteobacteria bacterium]